MFVDVQMCAYVHDYRYMGVHVHCTSVLYILQVDVHCTSVLYILQVDVHCTSVLYILQVHV